MQIVNKAFINGVFVTPHGTQQLELENPATGETITRVTLADEVDTKNAIAAANAAFKTYSQSSLQTRQEYLQRIHDVMVAKFDQLVDIINNEYGAPQWFTKFALQDAIRSWLVAKEQLKPETFRYHLKEGAEVILDPVGVAALISPWNISLWFMCVKASTAIAAGCTVVMKPSELSAQQNNAMAEIFKEANLPPGLINVLNGNGEVVGNELTRNPGIHKISFTGSTAVGKLLLKNAADTMKRVTLELGGKSPSIIVEDADLEKAIPFVLQVGLQNSGQACIAGSRILIPESREAEITAALKKGVEAMKVGPATNQESAIGPLVSKRQYERVQDYIKKGIEEGAVLLTGGLGHPDGLEKGNFVKPTVFVKVDNHMTIAQEEIFGPVLSVITYKDDADAIRIANDSIYGLHAYIAGTDTARAKKIAEQLQAGRIAINGFVDEPRAPFGGFKQSGIGREFGKYGLEAFLEPKAVFDI
ncbi:aldehyde dehydrogenase family protein [Chitinophaga sp. SYP-B3965]|uniref:aldehyde dehydrogenase family protein n=1 Tax=Chitinophaga sp. SYP-B3965 TaxID=2663120 RepID=UPI00129A0378|nr:aldehyde dehydrogenase family protein [Chitinophaga sp. SYP-B3965]MRG45075.1 aldehyde dehydrogenase family protein [Chitinophaga sp. SYP-B3965]